MMGVLPETMTVLGPVSAADNGLDNDDNGVDGSCDIKLHVELSKTPCRCSLTLHTSILY